MNYEICFVMRYMYNVMNYEICFLNALYHTLKRGRNLKELIKPPFDTAIIILVQRQHPRLTLSRNLEFVQGNV